MKTLIETLQECRRQFARYAAEHKRKAHNFREQAAMVPATRATDNFKQADELRQKARDSDLKAKTNLEMVAKIDAALSGVEDGN